MLKKLVWCLLLGGLLCSCTQNNSSSMVVGGQETSDYSSAVKIMSLFWQENAYPQWSICTAIVVSDTTLLTAAHCLNDGVSLVAVKTESGNVVYTTRYKYHDEYDGKKSVHDIGVVLFPEGTFASNEKASLYNNIQDGKIVVDTKVLRLVGYGKYTKKWYQEDKEKSGRKRTGTNEISNNTLFCEPNTLQIVRISLHVSDEAIDAAGDKDYTDLALANGDSGGPAYLENTNLVLGIASGGATIPGVAGYCYSSPIYKDNLQFLKDVSALGADIPGIEKIIPVDKVSFKLR